MARSRRSNASWPSWIVATFVRVRLYPCNQVGKISFRFLIVAGACRAAKVAELRKEVAELQGIIYALRDEDRLLTNNDVRRFSPSQRKSAHAGARRPTVAQAGTDRHLGTAPGEHADLRMRLAKQY